MTRPNMRRWIPAALLAAVLGAACLAAPAQAQGSRLALEQDLDTDRALRELTTRLAQQATGLTMFQAGENAATIQQVGSDNVAEIDQVGSGNEAFIGHFGDANQTYLLQQGNGNRFSLQIHGDNNYLDYAQVGDGNVYDVVWQGNNTDLGVQTPVVQLGNGNQLIEIGHGGVPLMVEQRGNGMRMIIEHRSGF